MKKYLILLIATFCLTNFQFQTVATAQSQDECAIWLCLPGGFPAGCEAAKSAMLKRVRKGRSPLPGFSSCAAKNKYTNPADFSYTYNHVLEMAPIRVCTKTEERGRDNDSVCVAWGYTEPGFVPGYSCYEGHGKDRERIRGCVRPWREVKIYEKGQLIGDPFRF